MSVQSEINRISANVSDAFTAVEEKGGTVPSGATSDSLASSIRSIQGGGGGAQTISHAARNLLDNSDFTNVINQRGEDIYSTTETVNAKYTIDRWQLVDTYATASDNSNMQVLEDGSVYYVALSKRYGQFRQWMPNYDKYKGKTLTLAMYCHKAPTDTKLVLLINTTNAQEQVYLGNGINIVTMTIPYDASQVMVAVQNNSADVIAAFYPEWAALYEGEYTAETLPEYVPKGYAHEYLECCRYFYKPTRDDMALMGTCRSTTQARFVIPLRVPMRKTPVITNGTIAWLRYRGTSESNPSISSTTLYLRSSQIELNVTFSSSILVPYYVCAAQIDGNFSFSADLS